MELSSVGAMTTPAKFSFDSLRGLLHYCHSLSVDPYLKHNFTTLSSLSELDIRD